MLKSLLPAHVSEKRTVQDLYEGSERVQEILVLLYVDRVFEDRVYLPNDHVGL